VTQNGWALQYADESLKKDRDNDMDSSPLLNGH